MDRDELNSRLTPGDLILVRETYCDPGAPRAGIVIERVDDPLFDKYRVLAGGEVVLMYSWEFERADAQVQ